MDKFNEALLLLPENIRGAVQNNAYELPEEIRLRLGTAPAVVSGSREYKLKASPVTARDIQRVIDAATDSSVHAALPSLRNGFICRRGIRIGICGEAIIKDGCMQGYRHISSVNIRIPREIPGLFDKLGSDVFADGLCSVLVVSPPGAGKTTLIRSIVKFLSDKGYRVAVADERNEISSAGADGTGFDLGSCTDVITMADKLTGSMILLRGMNPQIIALDEISAPDDIEVINNIAGCGVRIIASCHADGLEEMQTRKLYREMLNSKIFRKLILIKLIDGKRNYSVLNI